MIIYILTNRIQGTLFSLFWPILLPDFLGRHPYICAMVSYYAMHFVLQVSLRVLHMSGGHVLALVQEMSPLNMNVNTPKKFLFLSFLAFNNLTSVQIYDVQKFSEHMTQFIEISERITHQRLGSVESAHLCVLCVTYSLIKCSSVHIDAF